jgi:hypothetical protein
MSRRRERGVNFSPRIVGPLRNAGRPVFRWSAPHITRVAISLRRIPYHDAVPRYSVRAKRLRADNDTRAFPCLLAVRSINP